MLSFLVELALILSAWVWSSCLRYGCWELCLEFGVWEGREDVRSEMYVICEFVWVLTGLGFYLFQGRWMGV